MADPVWYYARGDVERGPFTLPQIRALANASKLRPDDLVWKEGMDNWTAAREVADLFPPAGLVGDPPGSNGTGLAIDRAASPRTTATAGSELSEEIQGIFYRIGRVLALVGALSIVGSHGCEMLGERRVTRLVAVGELSAEGKLIVTPEKQAAQVAALEHQASAFTRGVIALLGLLSLLTGAVALMIFADRHERWLGVGMILVVVYTALTKFAH